MQMAVESWEPLTRVDDKTSVVVVVVVARRRLEDEEKAGGGQDSLGNRAKLRVKF